MVMWTVAFHQFVKLTTMVMIDTDRIGSCKSNYHTITMAPNKSVNRYV
jgi:uncharacterized RmlC-like cupin family protein